LDDKDKARVEIFGFHTNTQYRGKSVKEKNGMDGGELRMQCFAKRKRANQSPLESDVLHKKRPEVTIFVIDVQVDLPSTSLYLGSLTTSILQGVPVCYAA
jgi:hypothetical protein